MTCYYPDLGGSSDWMKQIFNYSEALFYQSTSDTEARSERAPWRLSICPQGDKPLGKQTAREINRPTHLWLEEWRYKRKIKVFVVIFSRVLRMTGTLSGAIQTLTGIAMMGELGQGKLCWTVTTIPPLAGDLDCRTTRWLKQHAQTSTRQGTHKLPSKMLIKRMESRGWPMD